MVHWLQRLTRDWQERDMVHGTYVTDKSVKRDHHDRSFIRVLTEGTAGWLLSTGVSLRGNKL
jgi:hypothetical protein